MVDVITFGSATFDVFLEETPIKVIESKKFLTGKGLCFSLGSKIPVGKVSSYSGGGAINTAFTFAKQGLKTLAIFNFGSDSISSEIISELKKEKISFLKENFQKDYKIPISVILLSKDGSRTILHTKRRHSLNFSLIKKLPKTKWIYLAPFTGEGTRIEDKKFLIKIIKESKKKKFFLASNPSVFDLEIYKKNPELLNYFDVLILNQEEASILTGIDFQKEKEIFAKLDNLVNGLVVMTKGSKGTIVSDGKNLWNVPVYKERKVVDRTGAGDGFASGFVSFLAKRNNFGKLFSKKKKNYLNLITEALKFASANATSIIERVGAHSGALDKNEWKEKRWKRLEIKVESRK